MFLLIDKPKGITSHDVIDHVRRMVNSEQSDQPSLSQSQLRRVKVGHAGTLDPNATGLLIVAVGRESTRQLWTKFGKLDKTYEAQITLGEESETDDTEGASRIKYQVSSIKAFTERKIGSVLRSFIGEQMQIPPIYSAIKVKGQPAYKLARKGREVELKPRRITVHSIKLLEYKYPILSIETRVSSGTYIRSLARDLGRELGTGAYLSNLRRTKIGKYKIVKAININDLSVDRILKSQIE